MPPDTNGLQINLQKINFCVQKRRRTLQYVLTISAKTGSIILAIATFDVNSVKNWAVRHTRNSRSMGGSDFKPVNAFPRSSDIPDSLPPSAKAKPPPEIK